jgi:hypothetical protein
MAPLTILSFNTQGNGLTGTVMRTRPYRNPAIIKVIRNMYFVGGNSSFAGRHSSQFASVEDANGLTRLQVPKAMVAFVATAVSFILICPTTLLINYF